MLDAETVRKFSENTVILEATLHSPSLGKWMEYFICEQGNDLSTVSTLFGELKNFVDKEIRLRDEVLEKNGN